MQDEPGLQAQAPRTQQAFLFPLGSDKQSLARSLNGCPVKGLNHPTKSCCRIHCGKMLPAYVTSSFDKRDHVTKS
eukprot:scaffold137407_cov15-Tisochrysis_lutea.AAC.1